MPHKLRPFQREDVNRIKAAGLNALVASAPGTGKTPLAVRALAETYPASWPVIVTCPASVSRHWAREFKRWSPGCKIHVVHDYATPLPRRQQNLVIILSWSLLDPRLHELLALRPKCIVADEAHYSKSEQALRSQAVAALCQVAPYVLLLTGTPIVNDPEEMAVLLSLLHTPKGRRPLVIRRLLEDVAPDVPPKKRSYLHVSLQAKDEREYRKAEEQFEEWLRGEKERLLGEGMAEDDVARALANEAMVKMGYLKRIIGDAKAYAAADFISRAARIGEPVVCFFEHQTTLTRLRSALHKQRIRHVVLDGSCTAKQRQKAIDRFQAHEVPVFLGSKAAKEGITLTAARHLVFVQRYFTSADEEQAEDRIRRIGQKHATTMWFLHAPGTIDDRLDDIVRTKRSLIRQHIGARVIPESDVENVRTLMARWDRAVRAPRPAAASLGVSGSALDPLPRPPHVHRLVFARPRWNAERAQVYARMHGYKVKKVVQDAQKVCLEMHPSQVFQKGSFASVEICSDIQALTGKRLPQRQERKIRQAIAS